MLLWFYRLPLWFVILGSYIIAFIWIKVSIYFHINKDFKNQTFNFINFAALLISIVLIIKATLVNRNSNNSSLILTPFKWIIDGIYNPEEYRTTLMNVVLYLPFGLTLSRLLNTKFTLQISLSLTILMSLFLCITIEAIQYLYTGGIAQTDDVIANTFGSALGAITLFYEQYKISRITKNYKFE